MNIGKQLKNTRAFLGLTQEEFSARIVTESFYSRIENGKSKISINDLLTILNYHNVSLYDFFISTDHIRHIKRSIMQAFINNDINKLKKYQRLLKSIQKKYQLEFEIMHAILNEKVDDLSKETVEKIRRQFVRIGKINEDTLFCINLLIPVIDFETLKVFMKYVVNFVEANELNNFSLQLLCHSLLDFLKRCYEENDKQEAERIFAFFANIPDNSHVLLEKLLAKCYEYLFNGYVAKLNKTIKVLKLSGYEKYAIKFEKNINKLKIEN